MHFDLADLSLFIHIGASSTLTAAAKRAHLSVATVSGRIKALEEQLDARLLYRTSRGIEMTPAGERLLRHARLICRQCDELKREFDKSDNSDTAHIRIFANTTAVTEFLPRILATYLARWPNVTIDLQERLTRDIIRGVIDGSTDMGIVAGEVDVPGLQALLFSTDTLVLVAPMGHPLARCKSVTLDEVAQYPMVGMHEGSTIVNFLREQYEHNGRILPLRIQLYSFESICKMIELGVGVGIVPDSAARRYAASMALCIMPIDEPWVIRKRSILLRSGVAISPCTQMLIDAIKQEPA